MVRLDYEPPRPRRSWRRRLRPYAGFAFFMCLGPSMTLFFVNEDPQAWYWGGTAAAIVMVSLVVIWGE